MSIHIEQSAERKGPRQWAWAVWLGPQDELDQVERVVYHLHPTFSQPIQERTKRENGFRLDATGWGEFMIIADVYSTTAQESQSIRHWLRLGDDANEPTTDTSRGPKVLVSSTFANSDLAAKLAEKLDSEGFETVTADDIPVGVELLSPKFQEVFGKLAGAVVVVPESGRESRWLKQEVEDLTDREVPIIPLSVGGKSTLPSELSSYASVSVNALDDAGLDQATDAISTSLKKIGV